MTVQIFYTKQYNTGPAIVCQLKDADGVVVDLTGATVNFHMYKIKGTRITDKIYAAAEIVGTPTDGTVKYGAPWVSTDLDTAGDFMADWDVEFPDERGNQTFPDREIDNIVVRIAKHTAET